MNKNMKSQRNHTHIRTVIGKRRMKMVLVYALAADGELGNNWIIDVGATCHICCNHAMFDEYTSDRNMRGVSRLQSEEQFN